MRFADGERWATVGLPDDAPDRREVERDNRPATAWPSDEWLAGYRRSDPFNPENQS